jgi:hypothetical protein
VYRIRALTAIASIIAIHSFAAPSRADDATEQKILQRLDALEKENAALKKRINQLDAGHAHPASAAANTPAPPPTAAAPKGTTASAVTQDFDPQPGTVVPVYKVPVRSVRACDIYGAGFLYVPGTETCLKIGGYLRFQGAVGASGDGTVIGADNMAAQGLNNRLNTSQFNYDARAVMSLDWRVPTSLGDVRAYARFGAEMDTPIGPAYMTTVPVATGAPNTPFLLWDRGYVQFDGATVGKARSFFDIWAASDGDLTYGNLRTTGDTDLTGVILAAYTYRWVNGFSTSISVEDPNGHYKIGVSNLGVPAFGLGTITTANAFTTATGEGVGIPDIVANLRVDQPWGYAGLSAALHQVAASYYSPLPAAIPGCAAGLSCAGNPSDRFGYAIGGGGNVFVPTGKGDTLGIDAVYSLGAVDYATKGNRWQLYSGGTAAFAWGVDGVFDTPGALSNGAIELTQAWSINGGYEHHWNDRWKTSLYGGYAAINYDQNAKNMINSHLPGAVGTVVCGVPVAGAVEPPLGIAPGSGNSCSPSYSFWQVGTRTQFSPLPWLDLGVDTSFTRLNTAYAGSGVVLPTNGAQAAGAYTIANQNVWTVLGRVQINFLPGK